jgi:hypothetical protein
VVVFVTLDLVVVVAIGDLVVVVIGFGVVVVIVALTVGFIGYKPIEHLLVLFLAKYIYLS